MHLLARSLDWWHCIWGLNQVGLEWGHMAVTRSPLGLQLPCLFPEEWIGTILARSVWSVNETASETIAEHSWSQVTGLLWGYSWVHRQWAWNQRNGLVWFLLGPWAGLCRVPGCAGLPPGPQYNKVGARSQGHFRICGQVCSPWDCYHGYG